MSRSESRRESRTRHDTSYFTTYRYPTRAVRQVVEMTAAQAEELARRIVNLWRSTAPLSEWVEALLPLDHARALAAFSVCRDRIADVLPIAHYRQAYDVPTLVAGWQRPADTGEPISLQDYLARNPDSPIRRLQNGRPIVDTADL